MTEGRRFDLSIPAHVGVILGLSTGAYALAVAGVTGLQSSTEAAISAERAPTIAKIEAMSIAHDRVDAQLGRARAAWEAAAGSYSAAGLEVADLETQLSALYATVSDVRATAAALPTKVRLPTAGQSATSTRTSSGGGSTGGGAAAAAPARGSTFVAPALAAPAKAAPAVQATTTASGG